MRFGTLWQVYWFKVQGRRLPSVSYLTASARTTLEIYAHVLRDDHQVEQIESVLLRPSGT
jgi:hypothetical protein